MALFNKINRRIKSMQEGGQPFGGNVVMPEVDDGSIGGFNRPELRGLRKQARRGTLTNRERRRLNYLTNEVKGRRKRGLLSGLGGAAAALGTAALIKSGGAKGLMDSIKGRVSDLGAGIANKRMAKMLEEEQRERFGIGEKKAKEPKVNIDDIEVDDLEDIEEEEEVIEGEKSGEELGREAAAMRQLMEEQKDLEESDRLTDEEQLQEATTEADKLSAIEEAKAAGTYKRVGPPRGGSTPEEEFAKGTSTEDMLKALQNVETPEERQRILDKMRVVRGGGGGMTLEEIQKDKEQRQQMILEEAKQNIQNREELEKGRGASGGPLQGGVPSGQGEEVDTSMSSKQMLEALSKGVDPEVLGAVRGEENPALASIAAKPGDDDYLLGLHNKQRVEMGLRPVEELTDEALREVEAGPLRRLNPRAPRLLNQKVGGMVKRMIQRYN